MEQPADIFCKIIAGDIPSEKVYEDTEVIAIRDIAPKAPAHILVIPKRHFASLEEATEVDFDLMGRLLKTIRRIAQSQGLTQAGYRVVLNNGPHSGQEVAHVHFHILGGAKLGGMAQTE